MIHQEIIPVFSQTWWIWNLVTTGLIVLVIRMSMAASLNTRKLIASLLGYLLLFIACFYHVFLIYTGNWNLQTSLPLNLCAISGFLSGLALLFPNQLLFELILFCGVPGAFHSLITPEFFSGSHGWYFCDYYISHGGIILSALYLAMVYKMYPRKCSWFWVFGYSQILVILVYLVDIWIGSNYMYLISKPIAENPIVIGNWPWYIVGFELAAFIHMYILYVMFRKLSVSKKLS